MYRELLNEIIKKTDMPKLQNPCTENDIAEAEKVVGYMFPEELKKLLRETDGDKYFLLSAKEIIKNVITTTIHTIIKCFFIHPPDILNL